MTFIGPLPRGRAAGEGGGAHWSAEEIQFTGPEGQHIKEFHRLHFPLAVSKCQRDGEEGQAGF